MRNEDCELLLEEPPDEGGKIRKALDQEEDNDDHKPIFVFDVARKRRFSVETRSFSKNYKELIIVGQAR